MRASRQTLPKRYPAEYACWRSLLERERRGTAVVHEAFQTFEGFFAHMKTMPRKGFTVDRLDHSNPLYGPGLVRWADKRTQTENRRNTIFLTYSGTKFPQHSGKKLPLTRWAELTDTPPQTLRRRRSEGWSETEIIDGERANVGKSFKQMTVRELLDYQPWEPERAAEDEADFQDVHMQFKDRFDWLLSAYSRDLSRLRKKHRNTAYWMHDETERDEYLSSTPRRLRTDGDWGRKPGVPDKAWNALVRAYEDHKQSRAEVEVEYREWERALRLAHAKDRNSPSAKSVRERIMEAHKLKERKEWEA
jgi:hypothetical protein